MRVPIEKQKVIERIGVLRRMWGDRDYGPLIYSEPFDPLTAKGFDPDEAFESIPDNARVKIRIEITILEEKKTYE